MRALGRLVLMIVKQRRALEAAYGAYCYVVHRPSPIHSCEDADALAAIVARTREFTEFSWWSRAELIARYRSAGAVHLLPDTFSSARRESVWRGAGQLIVGEYGEGARLACITDHSCTTNEYYQTIAGVRHIHAVHPYGDAGQFIVSTGDGHKFLDLWAVRNGEMRIEGRLKERLAGYTAVAEVNGIYYAGTDFSGRPNYIEVLGGPKYFFPEKAYRLYTEIFRVVDDRYIVSLNKELDRSGGRRTLSVFDTVPKTFVYCENV